MTQVLKQINSEKYTLQEQIDYQNKQYEKELSLALANSIKDTAASSQMSLGEKKSARI